VNKNYIRRGAMIRFLPRTPHKHLYSRVARMTRSGIRWGCDTCPALTPWDNDRASVALVRDLMVKGMADNRDGITAIFEQLGKGAQRFADGLKGFKPDVALSGVQKSFRIASRAVLEADLAGFNPTGVRNDARWTVDNDGRTPDEKPQSRVVKFHADGCNDMKCDSGCLYDDVIPSIVIDNLQLDSVSLVPAGQGTGTIEEVTVIDADHPHANILEPVIDPEDAVDNNPTDCRNPVCDMHSNEPEDEGDWEEDEGFQYEPGKKYTREDMADLLKADVYYIAQQMNIKGRAKMTRNELVEAIVTINSEPLNQP
jgi:hypothetical protein